MYIYAALICSSSPQAHTPIPAGASWGPFRRVLGPLGSLLGPPGANWGPLGGILEPIFVQKCRKLCKLQHFGPPQGTCPKPIVSPCVPLWGVLGASWGLSGPTWGLSEASWGLFEASWGLQGPSWGMLEPMFVEKVQKSVNCRISGLPKEHSRSLLWPLGCRLGASWGHLGASWGTLGAS